jgi:endonuclease-3
MDKRARAKLVQKILNEYFPEPAIPLTHADAYTLLIAVLLSAQCTDVRVNQVTPALFALADTPQKMAKCSEDEIRAIIRPCGLSQRKAKAIRDLSEILIQEFDGQVPNSLEQLETLPGVGHKTASVVIAQSFQMPAFPVDTHIFRLARRWGLSRGTTVKKVEEDLKKLFKKEDWIRLHLQIIYFARSFCPALRHNEQGCPICSHFLKNSPCAGMAKPK